MTFALNALGNVTAEQTFAPGSVLAKTSTRAYDELGRMIQSVGAGGQTWSYAYDKVGNLLSTTDARGKLWSATVDNHNRPKTETNPQSQTENKVWSQADGLTQLRDGRNLATDNVIDGFGNVIRETSPDRGVTTYTYDAADRLTSVLDADGVTTTLAYDNAGRTLSETSTGAGFTAQTVTYSYDDQSGGNMGKGRLTGVTDPSGSEALVYDAQGRVTQRAKVINGLGASPPPDRTYTFQYAYDANGEVSSITYPSGHVVDYTRRPDGKVTAVRTRTSAMSAPADLATSVTYKPFGPLSGLTYGNGLSLVRSHDQNYWLTGQTLTGTAGTLLGMSIARDANGNVSVVTDSAAATRNASYTYTDANRLATASGLWGSDAYTWDANGNRTRADRTAGANTASDVATIPAASNRQSEVRDGAGVLAKSFAYRASGDVVSKTDGATTTGFTYDARGRMVAVTQGAATLASYLYDHSGQRVASMDQSGVQAHYLFDDDGRLLAEYDALTGNLLLEYVWLEGQAIALASGAVASPTWRYITTGHLDEPLLVTDQAQGVISSTTRDAWGNTIVLAGSDVLTLSYPGQWKALTAGLYHNWHRDYDPSLGRYVQADPIGLAGGSNLYAYVGGNPLNAIDPEGLSPTAGEIINFGFDFWIKRQIKNAVTRRIPVIGQALSIGDAIGTIAGVAVAISNCPTLEMAKITKKERSTEYPGWVDSYNQDPDENCEEFATSVLNDKYGVGKWRKGAGTEYNKIVKACRRGGARW